MIPALVLTAGLGTRLRPISRMCAKVAVPVAGRPLINRILTQLASYGVRDVVLNLHYLPETITSIVGDGTNTGVRVRYSWEMPILGSAGGPKRALPLLNEKQFLIVNGDTLTNVNIPAFVEAHNRSGALVTLALKPNVEPHKYGGVTMDNQGIVTGFVDKGNKASYHFVGVQIASADAFKDVVDGSPSESIAELYPQLIRHQVGSIRGWLTDTDFYDIGTAVDYLNTCLRIAEREGITLNKNALIDRTAAVTESILWNDVIVEAGVKLNRCIVVDGVKVPAGQTWSNVTMRPALENLEPGETVVGKIAIAKIV